MTSRRRAKFEAVVKRRQPNLTVILENVFDTHNVGAVMRSCDSVGIKEIFVLNNEPKTFKRPKIKMGKRTSAGSRKWVDVHYYTDTKTCFEVVRKHYETIWATHLSHDAKTLHELDLTQSVALLFGNEREGLSEESLAYADGNFIIPQVGMTESLNISVACAISVYEAYRQRAIKGFYKDNPLLSDTEQAALLEVYLERAANKDNQEMVERKG